LSTGVIDLLPGENIDDADGNSKEGLLTTRVSGHRCLHLAYANRNENKQLRSGEGTLRAEPLAEALARFEPPATAITESPDEESHQAIRAVLLGSGAAR
jgi:hypothetical protein